MRTPDRTIRLAVSLLLLPFAPAAAQNVLTVTVSGNTLHAPDTIPAGWTTVRIVNRDRQMHVAQLLRLDGGHTLEEYRKTYHEAWRTDAPRPVWGVRAGGAGADGGGTAEATMHLEPGTYGLYCFMDTETGVPHMFETGEIRELTVVPAASAAAAPPPEPTVTLTMTDYAFGLSQALTEGRHVIRVTNRGSQPHEVSLIRLPDGMSGEGFQQALRGYMAMKEAAKRGEKTAPVELPPFEMLGGVVGLAGGLEGYFEADVTPGAYVLVCFVTAPDGRPHVAHGMVQYFRVPG